MKNTTPASEDHSGSVKTNPPDATSPVSGTTPVTSTPVAGNSSTTPPVTTITTPAKPSASVGVKPNTATNGSNNNSSAASTPDIKAPSATSPSSGGGVSGVPKPASNSSQGPTTPVTSSRPPPPSRPPPSTPTTPPPASGVTAATTGAASTTTTSGESKDGKASSNTETGVRKSLIERFGFLSRSKESNLDKSGGAGSNPGQQAQARTGVVELSDKGPADSDEAKKEKEKQEKEEKKRKKEEEKRKKEEEKKRKKEEEQERKKREKLEKEKVPEGLDSCPPEQQEEDPSNGGWDKQNKSKVMEIEACRKVKSSDPSPNATTVVQWSPGSFRPRAMRSGVYIVNDPRSNRGDTSSPPYNGNCPQLKKMAGDSVNVDIDDTMERTGNIYRSALTKLVCCLYALVIIALGVVFATSDALTARERQHKYYLEIFLIYLYVMSLAVLLYFHVHLLRGMRNTYFEKNLRITIRRSQDNLHKSISTEPTSDDNEEQVTTALSDTPTKTCSPDQVSTSSHASSQSHLELPAEGTAAHVGEGINFYLRLGCLAFSLGSVALDGFHIATYFETESTATCESPLFPMVYVVHLLFVFVQTFFVFKNHKLVINKSKALVRFGLMHLLATNLCIWSSTAIAETAKDYRQQEFFREHNAQSSAQSAKSVTNTTKSCFEDVTLARVASPYLFPCTIMYSLIASGIIHRMYLYVGVKVKQKWPSHMSLTSSQPQSTASMDCEKANRGLFLGLLIGVITLIAIATFFVFEVRISDSETAIKVFFITEIALLVITTIGVILGYLRLSTLRFRGSRMISLDSILLIIALSGTYVYLFLLLISSASGFEEFGMVAILSVICICMELVQLSVQAVFLLDGLCRSIKYDEQQTRKPGRAIVTFLLVCNLALWSVSSFEVKKTTVVPLHERFFGLLAWNIIIHLFLPLLIFIRFHSVICLSEIWYDAYQKDKDH